MDPLLLLMAGLLVIIVLQILRGRRVQKQALRTQSSVTVGAEVVTTAGLMGTVVAVDDDSVTIESVAGARTRWVRAAVARVVEPQAPQPTDPAPTD